MTNRLAELRAEASEAVAKIRFLQLVEETERTDITISLRRHIRPDLFVQIFYGAQSGSLYMTLIEARQRIFGIDDEGAAWHSHPYGETDRSQLRHPLRMLRAMFAELWLARELAWRLAAREPSWHVYGIIVH